MTPQDKPVRVQLSRAKGWKMPENTVKVDRSTRLGNPFIVNPHVRPGARSGVGYICLPTAEDAIACFREMLTCPGPTGDAFRAQLPSLRNKNLACWCRLCPAHKDGKPFGLHCEACAPCHSDPLGELANAPSPSGEKR